MSVTGPVSPSRGQKFATTKRTNSLGWATSDCHRCSSLSRHCNRQRPRCSACLADGIICAGYVQQLNWEGSKSRKGKSARNERTKKLDLSKSVEAIAQLPRPTEFTFVAQSTVSDRSRKKSFDQPSPSKPTTPLAFEVIDTVLRDSSSTTYELSSKDSSSPWPVSRTASPVSVNDVLQLNFSISPKVYRLPGDLEDSLSFYHECFSYTTLTFPVHINPWQSAILHINDNIPCVQYAAVALAQRQQAHLSGQHENLSVLRLKDRALSIFGTHLNDVSLESAVSTALLLLALDYIESGYSNWIVHLQGAYRILESHGGIIMAKDRANLRSQIAQLLWYDVVAALLSRCGPAFPRSYLDQLMSWQSEAEWSMLALNGLPDDMFCDMYDLAAAATHPETVTLSERSSFQTKIATTFIETHGNEYFYAMSESWKLGLLLYCARVFPFSETQSVSSNAKPAISNPSSLLSIDMDPNSWANPHELAIRILEHVQSLPPHSSLQKQCLMPIMLAGCEIRPDERELRQVVVDYGERWKRKTGFWLWNSGSEFLGSVWAANEQALMTGRPSVSWTEVFPPSADYGFLFG
ncbi:uncharacterized protein A1O9_09009 [Exophiala aquamarina CBS 119918]|uniref:Zn(2)-C6 fungal-type domain-containing protein n=1 Tax=Exophiala aquamarina CBS 119918 TaxID=1182545 RepID=A0A072P4D1_9EURO|nr:uncharacterized protein A1O9_09009 [Exophiala aquamarina CBS 119918]KEF54567.1 hypothetical protein A1O9_09009 [Exophiala aquamarina CBS 119918]